MLILSRMFKYRNKFFVRSILVFNRQRFFLMLFLRYYKKYTKYYLNYLYTVLFFFLFLVSHFRGTGLYSKFGGQALS